MHKCFKAALAVAAISAAPAAYADEAPASDVTITGSVSLTTQYRLRGISQTDEKAAIQGGITVAHSSGIYVGTWASNLGGFGTFGGSNMEVDAIIGYSKPIGNVTLDGGLIWYFYPGTSGHDYGEVYASASVPLGPMKAKLGANYAFNDSSLGGDNLWVYADLAFPIKDTPITLKAHGGYTTGKSFLAGPDGNYMDYSIGADVTWKNLTLNVSYVGSDIKKGPADAFFVPGGHDIADGAVVATLTAAF